MDKVVNFSEVYKSGYVMIATSRIGAFLTIRHSGLLLCYLKRSPVVPRFKPLLSVPLLNITRKVHLIVCVSMGDNNILFT